MSLLLKKEAPPPQTGPADASDQKKFYAAIVGYPIVVALIALALSLYVLPTLVSGTSWPENTVLIAIALATGLLIVNHSWIITATELARLKHGIYVVPEEIPSEKQATYAPSSEGQADVARCHNIHRNTTENVVYIFPLAIAIWLAAPQLTESAIWIVTFAVARLGYTYSYLRANTALRSVCMTASLLAMFGLSFQLLYALAQ